jgi:hypothetical protein
LIKRTRITAGVQVAFLCSQIDGPDVFGGTLTSKVCALYTNSILSVVVILQAAFTGWLLSGFVIRYRLVCSYGIKRFTPFEQGTSVKSRRCSAAAQRLVVRVSSRVLFSGKQNADRNNAGTSSHHGCERCRI